MTWRSTPQSGVDRMVSTGWNAGRRSSPVARQGRAIARGLEGRPAFQHHHIQRSKQTKTASPASFSLDLDHGISPGLQPFWLLSGRNSTYPAVQISRASSLVKVHARQPDGSLKPINFEIKQDPEFEAGGGLYSTAGDYLKFCQMILHDGQAANGQQVLRPETVATMGRNQMGTLKV